MFPRRGAREVAARGGSRAAGDLRRPAPQLPQLARPETRAARGAGGGSSWWQDRDVGPGLGRRSPSPPVPPAATRRVQRHVLPPLLSPPAPWGSGPRRPQPGEPEAARRGVGRETPDPVGALLGELLPCKFREFLSQLRAKCAEDESEPEPEPQGPSAPPSAPGCQSGASQPWRGSPQCPSCQFLPDLRDQLSDFQERLEKILHHQKSSLGPLRGDHSRFPRVRKASPFCNTAAPEAVPTPAPSGEGLGPRRRSCPFRVRFADETLTDCALRYWERSCAVQQSRTAPQLAESGSTPGLRRWLDSLPRAGYLGAKEDAMASSPCWAQPSHAPCVPPRPQAWDPGCARLPGSCLPRPAQEPQGYLYKGTPPNGSLPFVPRASAPRPWRDLQGLLDTCSFLEQVGRSPCSWSQEPEVFLPSLVLQSVLKHSYPKGYPKGY